MIFNPMLNENVFEFPNFRFEEKEIQNPHFNRRNTDSNKKKMETYFNDIINKCKEKVKLFIMKISKKIMNKKKQII